MLSYIFGEMQKLILLIGVMWIGFLQTPSAKEPAFEVATIKPSVSGDNRVMIGGSPGGRFTVMNATLKMVIGVAYRVRQPTTRN